MVRFPNVFHDHIFAFLLYIILQRRPQRVITTITHIMAWVRCTA
jgi:hypothetical protein